MIPSSQRTTSQEETTISSSLNQDIQHPKPISNILHCSSAIIASPVSSTTKTSPDEKDDDDKNTTTGSSITSTSHPSPFASNDDNNNTLVNVLSARQGARVLFATDEWFATADNLVNDSPPSFDPDAYCEQGKVMDGWESRRRREAGHDWCIIRLAPTQRVTKIVGIEIDTAFFTGNQVPHISLQLADLSCEQEIKMVSGFPGVLERLLYGGGIQGTGATPDQVDQAERACRGIEWKEILPKYPLQPGYEATRMHYFTLPQQQQSVTGTHLRVNYFPDGGVARIRLLGHVSQQQNRPVAGPAYSPITTGKICTVVSHGSSPDVCMPSQEELPPNVLELSAQENGGIGLSCSNKHYGEPSNLIQSNFGRDMGDGWETARHPDRPGILVRDPKTGLVDSPLSDWCILKLGHVAENGITRIILDTKHFRGNYPESVQVEGCFSQDDDNLDKVDDDVAVPWFPLIPRCRMAPDSEHVFDRCSMNNHHQIKNASGKVSHVRITIYPDGGLSRVRVYGEV